MENSIFPRPEVVRELQKYVEVRLHVDRAEPKYEKQKQIQQERLNDLSLPIYEVVDPKTRKTVDVLRGATTAGSFREFLRKNAR